jgi:hypothetical protein
MRLPVSFAVARSLTVAVRFLLCAACGFGAAAPTYHILGDEPGAWPKILSSIGLQPIAGGPAGVVVVRRGSPQTAAAWKARIDQGLILVLEGESELAQSFGFKPGTKRVAVSSLKDVRAPKLSIVWEQALEMPVYDLPAQARVFTAERWEGAPLVAGYTQGKGAVLWVAINPGAEGYERFPYLLHALTDLGMPVPYRSSRLWAFFDSSYRLRVDLDYFAKRWRASGVAALQVAAWHFYDGDPEQAAYLKRLIEACHRESILVYAWLELPHVSDGFWQAHPEWREKTALLDDAQLDWRKLINLTNRAAFTEASKGVRALIEDYDWDGVNLAELYFESLEGMANPARFTPMNDDVRAEFRAKNGADPIVLFQNPAVADRDKIERSFLDYRAGLARKQQGEWLGVLEQIRRKKPYLDLALTQIDDRFDPRAHDLLGADASLTLPLLEEHDFTYLIEDPATIWNLGPKRYPQIAAKYQPLTPRQSKLAIDINVVERYQDVYPTKQQTGTELFQLVNLAARAFPRVALYFEQSILSPDLAMLASAAAAVSKVEQNGTRTVIDSPGGVGIPWTGAALVDGQPWPVRDATTAWIPAGQHSIEPGGTDPGLRIEDFNGSIKSAVWTGQGVEFSYESSARVFCRLSKAPVSLEVDGETVPAGANAELILPRGQHVVAVR